MKRWIYKQYEINSKEVRRLAGECKISRVAACVLLNRGICTPEEVDKFLNISEKNLENPALLDGIDAVAGKIEEAIANKKKITIYGDYDVDGITSTCLMLLYLKERGVNADYYIPSRNEEGYGINAKALKKIKFSGTDLVISVDTGITAVNEVEFAKIINLDVVITDHHQRMEEIPDCPIINPHIGNYPFKNLAGVGVVFKLITYMENNDAASILDRYADIVALGTIADVVSITGENRIIVERGLKKLCENPNFGIKRLINVAMAKEREIDSTAVGFTIAPRINAAGRIGDTSKAVELLINQDDGKCKEIATYLDEQNKLRQTTEQQILDAAIMSAEAQKDKKVIVIKGIAWHHGVIGIVASRITDKFGKPCILISCENGIGKGSGRSVKGFNLFEALASCGDIFIKFGGHELAAGLTIDEENIELLDKLLNEYADKNMDPECLIPYVEIDSELPIEYLNSDTISGLERLKPFGAENPNPVFSISGARLISKRAMSGGKHLAFKVEKNGTIFEAVMFGGGELYNEFKESDRIDVAGILRVNSWNNIENIQLLAKALRISEAKEEYMSRADLAAIYRFLKRHSRMGKITGIENIISGQLSREAGFVIDTEKFVNGLRVFAELSLITYMENDGTVDIYVNNFAGKVELEQSKILAELNKSC